MSDLRSTTRHGGPAISGELFSVGEPEANGRPAAAGEQPEVAAGNLPSAEPGATGRSHAVTISIPADTKWVRTVRLATTGVAATGPFDLESIDDLRIAVDEVCAALLETGDGGPISLELHCEDGCFAAVGTTGATRELSPVEDWFDLSRQILSVVSDDFGLEVTDGTARCWFRRSVRSVAVEGPDSSTPPAGTGDRLA